MSKVPIQEAEHIAYQQDSFFGLMWRWRWASNGTIDPFSLTPFCPLCDRVIPVSLDGYGPTRFNCDVCRGERVLDGNLPHSLNRVLRKIDLKIHKGTWRENTGPE